MELQQLFWGESLVFEVAVVASPLLRLFFVVDILDNFLVVVVPVCADVRVDRLDWLASFLALSGD